jgi:hypothetical protein
MDITVQLGVGMSAGAVSVSDESVDVKVNLDTFADVDSWCSNAAAGIVKPFIGHIVGNEVISQIAGSLTSEINKVISSAAGEDHLHRAYALTSFVFDSNGASFTVCPTTSLTPPPPVAEA